MTALRTVPAAVAASYFNVIPVFDRGNLLGAAVLSGSPFSSSAKRSPRCKGLAREPSFFPSSGSFN
jgi:hypothetical protein